MSLDLKTNVINNGLEFRITNFAGNESGSSKLIITNDYMILIQSEI